MNIKMTQIVCIILFISREKFMLSIVERKERFITSGLDQPLRKNTYCQYKVCLKTRIMTKINLYQLDFRRREIHVTWNLSQKKGKKK